jgi:hydrogenase maturation protease
MARVLVAGIGNVFFGDDGFGVEVARRLAAAPLPENVEVVDAGIAGIHLAYRLLDGYDLFIAVDAVVRGAPPGTVYVLEPCLDEGELGRADAHSVDLRGVFSMVRALGGNLGRVIVVGCEPAELKEQMGLSAAATAALEPAMRRVRQIAEGAAQS